jgi:tripartite-type tricarboxylate transporter receptor subunit TctC
VLAAPVGAQSFPDRPIRLILGVAPGGGQDTVARAMAPRLGKEVGANMVVDNRPGAGGSIGAELAKQASPDGHTLLMISLSNVIGPILYGASYDVRRDFAPVAQLVTQPYLLVVTPSLPVKSVADLISHAKSNPGKLSFGSAGSGSLTHLAAELFREQAQFDAVHIPYKGMGAVYPDLIGGRIHFSFSTIVSAQPHARAQRLRVLAVSSEKRVKSAPTIPTVAEAGVPGYAVTQLYGVLAPARTPDAIVNKLNKALVSVIEDPEMSKHLANDGAEASGSTPQQFAAQLRTEHERWQRVIEKAGLQKVK